MLNDRLGAIDDGSVQIQQDSLERLSLHWRFKCCLIGFQKHDGNGGSGVGRSGQAKNS